MFYRHLCVTWLKLYGTPDRSSKQLYDWLADYIQHHQHCPSIRQMMQAMKLKSPAPIQSRLEHLRAKDTLNGQKARHERFGCCNPETGVPVLGAIAAGGLLEPFTDAVEQLDFSSLLLHHPMPAGYGRQHDRRLHYQGM